MIESAFAVLRALTTSPFREEWRKHFLENHISDSLICTVVDIMDEHHADEPTLQEQACLLIEAFAAEETNRPKLQKTQTQLENAKEAIQNERHKGFPDRALKAIGA